MVISSPANPAYWWGNFILLAEPPPPAGTADRWLSRFAAEFPGAGHVIFGVDVTDGTGVDPAGFQAAGLQFGCDIVLTANVVHPPPRPDRTASYRPLASPGDWRQAAELRAACRTDGGPGADSDFLHRRVAAERGLTEAGHGAWFGAFRDGRLLAQLGIFSVGSGIARYQNVETHPAARGQGLAGTLVYHAGRYGLRQLAASTLVIVAEPAHVAARFYRSVGFDARGDQVSFERPPGADALRAVPRPKFPPAGRGSWWSACGNAGRSDALLDYMWPRRWETPRRSKARCCTGVGVVIMVKPGRPAAGWMWLAAMVARSSSRVAKL